MPDPMQTPDAETRLAALDPARSFIVQAPAGSGKTELLIWRYLALLARVDAPEEIVAITFTRKAAAEMRTRVLEALAAPETGNGSQHRKILNDFAAAVRARDSEAKWNLSANPNRLRIQTIDSLCASLTRQMPVLSRFGGPPDTVEDAAPLHQEAARRTLSELDSDGPQAEWVERLLTHLDNNWLQAADLIAGMLARRDHWMRHVAERASPRLERKNLEAALESLVRDELELLARLFPQELAAETLSLAAYAADNLSASGAISPILAAKNLKALPGYAPEDLAAWRAIAELLLTGTGEVRKDATVRTGFPPGATKAEKARCSAAKERFKRLAAAIAPHFGLIERLHRTRSLPPLTYSDAAWRVLEALTGLLPLSVAHLKVVFGERGQADFTEIAQAASRALGEPDSPTDLLLALDYRIRHLLVDEFQDTSFAQFELLGRLTLGWQANDARTLFLVGDPMQSIYRFREAEVGLFLQARRHGIGHLRLTPLTLHANFRSQQGIVDWCNEAFTRVMPAAENFADGAVPFVESKAVHGAAPGKAVVIHPQLNDDREREARLVVELARAAEPNETVAILVRARGHLAEIAPRLKEAGLRFQALEIEGLAHRPLVQDLLALTRALVHPADRAAWLSVLRAPCCGLLLSDLEALAGDDRESSVWELMNQEKILARLTQNGRERLLRVRPVLSDALKGRRREPVRRWVEGAWLAVGGPACAENETDLDNAMAYFALLEELDIGGDILDLERLTERVANLYAAADTQAGTHLQVMTIHKAKGLEFDVVIVPGLGYAPRSDEPRLLLWMEQPRERGAELALAPIRESRETKDAIYEYLKLLERNKQEHEDARLIYVAATRAKSRLHLIGHAKADEKGVKPAKHSLLERLWPAVKNDFEQAIKQGVPVESQPVPQAQLEDHSIRRLESNWRLPPPPEGLKWEPKPDLSFAARSPHDEIEFSWASETARHVGTVVHRFLQWITEEGLEKWDAARVGSMEPVFKRDLALMGVPEPEMELAVRRVAGALNSSLLDKRGQWVLGSHQDAKSEFRLTGLLNGEFVSVAMDRTFIDENGTRWIVDFKVSPHLGGEVEEFLDREKGRYSSQLQRYAALMRMREGNPVRLGLYFPLLRGWREWE